MDADLDRDQPEDGPYGPFQRRASDHEGRANLRDQDSDGARRTKYSVSTKRCRDRDSVEDGHFARRRQAVHDDRIRRPPGGFGPGRFSNVHPVVFRNVNVGDGTTGPDVAAEGNKDGPKEEKEPAKTASLAKVIYEGVDFKVKESTVEGNEWTMIVSATSLKVPHSIQFNRASDHEGREKL